MGHGDADLRVVGAESRSLHLGGRHFVRVRRQLWRYRELHRKGRLRSVVRAERDEWRLGWCDGGWRILVPRCNRSPGQRHFVQRFEQLCDRRRRFWFKVIWCDLRAVHSAHEVAADSDGFRRGAARQCALLALNQSESPASTRDCAATGSLTTAPLPCVVTVRSITSDSAVATSASA